MNQSGKWIWYNEDGSIENELDSVNKKILNENYAPAEYPGDQKKILEEYFKKAGYSRP